jgi:GT2 family glycosyltransferase
MFYEVPLPPDERPVPVEQLPGACMMVSRAAVEKAGTMDERFVLFYEDVDWCLRLAAVGPSYVLPSLCVIHKGGGSHEKRAFWLYGRFRVSMIRYFKKHHSPAAHILVRSLYHILSWTGLAVRNLQVSLLRRSGPDVIYHRDKYRFYFKEYNERCGTGHGARLNP